MKLTMTNRMTDPLSITHVPIHITAHHVHLSEFIHTFLQDKIGALARISKDVLAIDVVLRRTTDPGNERFAASVRLALPGHDIHSGAAAQDLYVAIGLVAAKLARHLRKRKTRLSKTYEARAEARRRRVTRNVAPAPLHVPAASRYWSGGPQRVPMFEATHL
ncbi:MAG: ribosome hibernation-promoting factor, HPF/YfiA family [Chthoniobacteraceae bacterium]